LIYRNTLSISIDMIALSNRRLMPAALVVTRAEWLISITDPETDVPTPDGFSTRRHQVFRFHDITKPVDTPGVVLPDRVVARDIVRVLSGIPSDEPVLIHCHAGISRSPAVALAAAYMRSPDQLQETAGALGDVAPWVAPNPTLVDALGEVLGTSIISEALKLMGLPRMRGCAAAVSIIPPTVHRITVSRDAT
jgi:predicted protein tyrosine phosphatase